MKIGNWKITENAIEWAGKAFQRFVIEKQMLLETVIPEDAGEEMYKWILLATEEDWLTADDLYDFNFAFVFGAGKWQLNLDYQLFDKTAAYQFELLDEEDETQPWQPG